MVGRSYRLWILGAGLCLSAGALAEAPGEAALAPTAAVAVSAPSASATTQPDAPTEPVDPAILEAEKALIESLMADPPPEEGSLVTGPARTQPRASVLPIPEAPPTPPRRKRFDIAPGDQAGEAARTIAQRVAYFRNFRSEVPGAVWQVDKDARFSVRGGATCLEALHALGVRAHPVERELTTPVPTPVVIDGPIEGVAFVSLHSDRQVEVSCELAAKLPALARVLHKHGVLAAGVNSSYRETPKVSFHIFGLALDLAAFRTKNRTLSVFKHFEVTPDERTCEAKPRSSEGKALLEIACAIAKSHVFSTLLTPNYNEGHRDHIHLDIRPDDPRTFVR